MGAFKSMTRKPLVGYRATEVNPPSPLYITRNDNLNVFVWNSLAGLTVRVRARVLLEDGTVVPHEFAYIPSSNRVQNSFSENLTEGFLLDVSAVAFVGEPRRGQAFIRVFIAQGDPDLFEFSQVLLSGYLTPETALAWPPGVLGYTVEGCGALRSIAGADPAAGVEISETVPTGARWKLWGFTFTLVTDATVANRIVDLVLDDGANIYYRAQVPTAQVASQTVIYSAAPQGVAQGVTNLRGLLPLPIPCLLFQGHRIRTVTQGIVAGDNFGAPRYLVEEWIET